MKTKSCILGVDPGFKGAIAITDGADLRVIDMPVRKAMGRLEIDSKAICQFIETHQNLIRMAVIEDVHAMPDQGVVSMFRFGYGAGIIAGILAAFNIPTVKIKPAVWKTALGLTKDKAASLQRARELYPNHGNLFHLKKHNDRAEATLMAWGSLKAF